MNPLLALPKRRPDRRGRTFGKALFEQSRDLALVPASVANPYRPAVTLATLSAMDADPDDGEDGIGDNELPPTVTH